MALSELIIMTLQVFVIWILDSLHIALITYSLYYYVVLKFGDPLAILEPSWGIMAMIMVSNVSNSIVRGVFSHRLWKLSRAMILPLLIGVLSLYIAADGFYFAIRGLQIKSYYDIHHFSWSLYVGFAFEVLTDGMTTVSQCLLLRRLRTGIRCTDSVIAILIVYSINTGLFTSICAILCLATYIVFPYGFIYFAFYFMLSKLYVNSLLANLNARATILERISPAPCAVTLDKGTVSDNVSSPDSSRLWPKSVQACHPVYCFAALNLPLAYATVHQRGRPDLADVYLCARIDPHGRLWRGWLSFWELTQFYGTTAFSAFPYLRFALQCSPPGRVATYSAGGVIACSSHMFTSIATRNVPLSLGGAMKR
ncbi:uncharacterized protein FIBRA_04833 [Fibroporia radiculosa]|uniref:DUF6534 domain-containing protein n=1 Tax=Fibroporia radiculosa TaxID=599839 RepID=J4IAD6_9APHY|nr:uncharacterized protein FIBRA_04833 [Fibroporia radiculosa]CCM02726.1 predicted protein [Fibroporia radiculosa]